MSNIGNVHVIQPVIPSYRASFFESLNYELKGKLHVYCSTTWPRAPKLVNLKIDNLNSSLKVLSFKNKIFYQSVFPVIKKIKAYDVVVISGNPRIISNYLIIAYCRIVKAKVVWWGHGWTAKSRGRRSRVRQKIMGFSDLILLYTDSEKEEYEKNKYVNRPVYALNNGLDLTEIDRYFSYDSSSYSSTKNIAVYCGRLTKKSNILLLLEAVKESSQIEKLIVVGDGEMFDECLKFISGNNMAEDIEMLGAIYDAEKLAEIFKKASVFVFPGVIGLSLIHAMAHALPVVLHGNRHHHGPENVAANSENSLFFLENDKRSLKDCIDEFFLLDDDVKLKMSKNSRLTIEKSFNTKDMIKRFLNMLDNLK